MTNEDAGVRTARSLVDAVDGEWGAVLAHLQGEAVEDAGVAPEIARSFDGWTCHTILSVDFDGGDWATLHLLHSADLTSGILVDYSDGVNLGAHALGPVTRESVADAMIAFLVDSQGWTGNQFHQAVSLDAPEWFGPRELTLLLGAAWAKGCDGAYATVAEYLEECPPS